LEDGQIPAWLWDWVTGQPLGIAVLMLVLLALLTGWLFAKPYVTELRRDRDDWKAIATKATDALDELTKRAEGRRR
jgi:hypothetical protein